MFADRQPTSLGDDTVPHLNTGHATTEVSRGVAVGHVSDQLEAKLARVEQALDVRVSLVLLHGLLDHDPGGQDVLQHPGQNSLSDLTMNEDHPAR